MNSEEKKAARNQIALMVLAHMLERPDVKIHEQHSATTLAADSFRIANKMVSRFDDEVTI